MTDTHLVDGTETAVTCPNCGPAAKLVIRTNGRSGEQFLGCPNYPACKYTRPLPEDVRLRLAGQKRLL